MKLEQYIKLINFRIGDGSQFLWKCFGDNARFIDYDPLGHENFHISAVYDTKTLEIYSLEFSDYTADVDYRWFHPDYLIAYQDEERKMNIDNAGYGNIKLVNIEVVEDIVDKIECALIGVSYDPRIKVPLDLPDDVFLKLARLAHEKDITLNQLFKQVIQDSIDKYDTNS